MKKQHFSLQPALIFVLTLLIITAACDSTETIDDQLQTVIAQQKITPLDPGPTQDPAKVKLGQALFFDKILSGNKDISCATCHHPTQNSGDSLPVSIGTGGVGVGVTRQIGHDRVLIPRNAPEVFNRGAGEWTTMFWDSRVAMGEDGSFISPADDRLPDGLDNVLAVQAMFPVTSGDEMRGAQGDVDVTGVANELAEIDGQDLPGIWAGLMVRLLVNPEYVALFQAAYPQIPSEELGFEDAANAIASFEIDAYTLANSPWQQYLNGNLAALSPEAKQGALLFYGEAGCVICHSGPLFTDQRHHALAVPQVGPGRGDEAPQDLGRFRETSSTADKYAFRTPPLHNVAVTGPWMHDGAFSTLEATVQHHLDPETSLREYDTAVHLPGPLRSTFQNAPELIEEMLHYLDAQLAPSRTLSPPEANNLITFLEALTDPAMVNLHQVTPDSVPSGLPILD
ncbi:MAG: cytochrome-c peroxidase [Chloroflexi bacterium]|nr:cytochrome-c peroxidase [Chloroflexota bacterium]